MISRLKIAVLSGLAASLGANAGQIQVGGVGGLTPTYVGTGGNLSNWTQKSFTSSLFQNATITPTPSQTNTLGASTFTDANGVTFDMMAGGTFLASPTSGTSNTIVVPVAAGATNVTGVDILLNDFAGYAGANPTITFNFTGGVDVDTIPDLANGSGGIRSAVNCTETTGGGSITCPNPSTTPSGNTISLPRRPSPTRKL